MTKLLVLGLLGAALALAGCADTANESSGNEATDGGGGDCPDSLTDTTSGGLDNDDTAQAGGAMDARNTRTTGDATTGGGDCPDAAGTDDDANVHTDTTSGGYVAP